MDTARNEVFIGFKHEIWYVVGGKKSVGGFFSCWGGTFQTILDKVFELPNELPNDLIRRILQKSVK